MAWTLLSLSEATALRSWQRCRFAVRLAQSNRPYRARHGARSPVRASPRQSCAAYNQRRAVRYRRDSLLHSCEQLASAGCAQTEPFCIAVTLRLCR